MKRLLGADPWTSSSDLRPKRKVSTVARRLFAPSLCPLLRPDGFTGDQRFFLGTAQMWRNKMRDEQLRTMVLTNEHSPQRLVT